MIDVGTALTNWMPQVQGRYINEDWNPENQGFGAQCWDIPANWSRYLGLPKISTGGKGRWPGWAGNMADAFPQSAEIAAAYELLPPSATVMGGDILVWDDSYPVWFPKTHTAVGVRDLGAQLLCISQNSTPSRADNPYPQWTTGPTTIQHLPRRGLLGIIRPRTGTITVQSTTEEGEDFMATLSEDEKKRWLAACDRINGVVRDSPVLNVKDGAYMNLTRDAQHAEVMAALGNTLDKKDGGYIVGLIHATKPGEEDPEAAADNLLQILPEQIAAQVVALMGQKLGGK